MKVLAIICNGSKILVGKLRQEKLADFGGLEYVFPGGSVEDNEAPINAVKREVLEETGLEINDFEIIAERIHPVTKFVIQYYYATAAVSDVNVNSPENDDIESYEWISLQVLQEKMPTVFPAVLEFIKVKLR